MIRPAQFWVKICVQIYFMVSLVRPASFLSFYFIFHNNYRGYNYKQVILPDSLLYKWYFHLMVLYNEVRQMDTDLISKFCWRYYDSLTATTTY